MSRAAITQAEIARAVSGAIKGGMAIGRVEVDIRRGRVIVLPAGAPADQDDDLDAELAEWRKSHGQG